MTAKIFSVILSLTALLAMVGCGVQGSAARTQKAGGSTTCTMIGAMAVSAYIPVASGNPNGINIKVSVNGVAKGNYTWNSGTNDSQFGSDGSFFSFDSGKLNWSGYTEVAGKYSIAVTTPSGSATKSVTVAKSADGCHVDGQVLNF